MKRHAAITVFIVAVIAVGGVWLYAAPPIGPFSVTPSVIAADSPTSVTFVTSISDPLLIPTSVNLFRVKADGTPLQSFGRLHDDGTNGDDVAGDRLFSRTLTLNEPTTGVVYFGLSTANRFRLKRLHSPAIPVNVWASFNDATMSMTLMLPPTIRNPSVAVMSLPAPSRDTDLTVSTTVDGHPQALFQVIISPLVPPASSLDDWLANTLDPTRILGEHGALQKVSLGAGREALFVSGLTPLDYPDALGTPCEAYMLSRDGSHVACIVRSQEGVLGQFYDEAMITTIYEDVLKFISF